MASLIKCTVGRRTAFTSNSIRAISTSSITRKDLVKDFYLREIKNYKPTPLAKDAHVGAVKNFSTPSSPKPPTLSADIAKELEAYDEAEPVSFESEPTSKDAAPSGAKEFLDFLEADLPKADAHH